MLCALSYPSLDLTDYIFLGWQTGAMLWDLCRLKSGFSADVKRVERQRRAALISVGDLKWERVKG